MGARQSRRSVDITTTSKNENESPIEGEGRLEKISELESKIATNGSIHNEIEYADKEETDKEEAAAAVKENGVSDSEGSKTPDADVSIGDQLNESSDLAEKSGDSLDKTEEMNESNKKNKDKSKKKKWSFRSISFSKKDKSKPGKESEKNGDVKEVNEEGAEEIPITATSPEASKSEDSVLPPSTTESAPALTNGEASSISVEPKTEEVPKPVEVVETQPEEQPPVNVETKLEVTSEESVVKEEIKVETPKEEVNDAKVEVDPPKVEVEEQKIVEVKPDEQVVAESKEVRNEEIPPPLPSSNPPSPVTVFAESTMADVPPVEQVPLTKTPEVEPTLTSISSPTSPIIDTNILNKGDSPEPPIESVAIASDVPSLESIAKPSATELPPPEPITELQPEPVAESLPEPVAESLPEPVAESLPEPVIESPQLPVEEPLVEPTPSPILTSSPPVPEIEPSSPVKEPEQVINADSLPDISTESLPSLPEPLSESLPEPMSLPPVDCIPEPIASEVSNSLLESEPIPNIPSESEKIQESVADIPLPNSEVILTNGDAHSPSSPNIINTSITTSLEGPIKQVSTVSELSEGKEEERHDSSVNDIKAPEPTAVEE